MSVAVLHSRALAGVASPRVTVEVHIAGGLPGIHIVGLPEAEVREARDCVFHANVDSDSTANWTPIPRETGQ